MSMPVWLNDVSTVHNNDNGTFNPTADPSMAFMHTPTVPNFEFAQLQNTQLQQQMQNGAVRNGSPAFHNPYQTQSIVPSKRSRAGTDVYSASPRQAPGTLPASRSQTPQQNQYAGFHGNVNGAQHMQAPTPYQHLQQGSSNNASPSPIMQEGHYNPQLIPQRMSTVSPSPFSPATQNYGSQASPPQSDYGSRVDTPQNGVQSYIQGMPYGGGLPQQHFTPPPGNANPGLQGNGPSAYPLNPQQQQQQQQQQQRIFEMRQQQIARQMHMTNNALQQRHQGGAPDHMAGALNPMANYQQAARPQQAQAGMARPTSAEQFLRNLSQFMQHRNLPFNPNPILGGQHIHVMHVYAAVMKYGGSKRATAAGAWGHIAHTLHFHPAQYPTAGQDMQSYWHSNLQHYEQTWLQAQQAQQMRQRAQHQGAPLQPPGGNMAAMQDQYSPVKQLHSQNQEQAAMMHARRQSGADVHTPIKQMIPQQHESRQPQMNGFITPQTVHNQGQQDHTPSINPYSLSTTPQSAPSLAQNPPAFPPTSAKKEPPSSRATPAPIPRNASQASMPKQLIPIGDTFSPSFYEDLETHGGITVPVFEGLIGELIYYTPNVPRFLELGMVDLRALTMSLKSGLHAEVRLALDTLATLSLEHGAISLDKCEDLVETLVECAEDQVELLAENAAEVSDVMLVSPYEDVVRGCKLEMESLVDVPEFGSLEYDLDRAVERLICITTILRNFSFSAETNYHLLADPIVVRFMTTVIRYLGTRNMLLRTYRNTLDFSKDIVIYLSNLSQSIDLPGKEEALCILHFLLSFAPSPPPTGSGNDEILFSSYSPSRHRYLPPAVDSLAKLLARDDPNRTFYKSIFAADIASSPPYELLTRAFALAIAPIPAHSSNILDMVKVRRPHLAQGLLAAEILTTLIPTTEHTLARSWLKSQDGFAVNLLHLSALLTVECPAKPLMHPQTGQVADPDPEGFGMITKRGITVLRKLAERSKDSEIATGGIPFSALPRSGALLKALTSSSANREVLQRLCAYAALDS